MMRGEGREGGIKVDEWMRRVERCVDNLCSVPFQ